MLSVRLTLAAIGLSPPAVQIENIKNNNVVIKQINIVRSDVDTKQCIRVKTVGNGVPYVNDFLKTLEILPGDQKKKFKFVIRPKSAPIGNYEVDFNFKEVFCDGIIDGEFLGDHVERTVDSQSFLVAKLTFNVTDQVFKKIQIVRAELRGSEAGRPAEFTYYVNNLGNIDTAVDQLRIKIYDSTYRELLKTFSYQNEQLSMIPALSSSQQGLALDLGLSAGHYSADFYFKVNKEVVYDVHNQRIHVLPEGSSKDLVKFEDLDINKTFFKQGEPVKLTAKVSNKSSISVLAVLVAEVRNQDQVITRLKSDPEFISAGRKGELSLSYPAYSAGDYRVDTKIEYGPYSTEAKRIVYKTGGGYPAKDYVTRYGHVFLMLLGVLGIVMIILFFQFDKAKK